MAATGPRWVRDDMAAYNRHVIREAARTPRRTAWAYSVLLILAVTYIGGHIIRWAIR